MRYVVSEKVLPESHISICTTVRVVPAKWGVLYWYVLATNKGLISSNVSFKSFRLVPLVYGIVLMSMVLYKTFRFIKNSTRSPRFGGSELFRVLILDQAVYFFLYVVSFYTIHLPRILTITLFFMREE